MATVFPPPRALCPYRSRSGPAPQNLVPPQAVPALTSCSEQRKMSVQRPVQQPMVAERRGCTSASLRAAGRSGGSPHPDGAAASPSPPPPRRPPASASPPPLSEGQRPRGAQPAAGTQPGSGEGAGAGGGRVRSGAGRAGRAAGTGSGGGRERDTRGVGCEETGLLPLRASRGHAAPSGNGAREGRLVAGARGKFTGLGRLKRAGRSLSYSHPPVWQPRELRAIEGGSSRRGRHSDRFLVPVQVLRRWTALWREARGCWGHGAVSWGACVNGAGKAAGSARNPSWAGSVRQLPAFRRRWGRRREDRVPIAETFWLKENR